MLSIDPNDVRHVARACRIRIADEEIELFARDLTRILSLVGQLSEVDGASYEPCYSVCTHVAPPRDDQIVHQSHTEILKEAAPYWKHDHFVVPKVIDQG